MLLKFRELLRKTVADVRPIHRRVREADLFKSTIARLFGFIHRVSGRRDHQDVIASGDDTWLSADLTITVTRGFPPHDLAEVYVRLKPVILKTVDGRSYNLFPGKVRVRIVGDGEANPDRDFVYSYSRLLTPDQFH